MYTCEHFSIKELVDDITYNKRGIKSWQLLDSRLLKLIDELRKRYGPMYINTWSFGGDRKWSGLRTSKSPYYSMFSQHSFGRAADCLFDDITAEEVRVDIKANTSLDIFKDIGGIENNVDWLHVDVRNSDGILWFNP